MPATYEPIATNTLGSAAATVTFSSIPGTYTDLVLVISARMSGGGGASAIQAQFNSDTASNYSFTLVTGTGSSVDSSGASSQTQMAVGLATDTAGEWSTNIIQVMNYSNTTTNKTVLARAGIASDRTRALVNLWRSTSAITSILIINNGSVNFVAGSTFTLYGILAA
jgi:hypothetical protein